LVYASLSETDPVATVIATSSVQSANNLAELRARAGTSTNQVWLTGYGMYVYDSTDHTSPEKIPYVIVGNDGSRYKHSDQYVTGPWVRTFAAADPSIQGTHVSWNDFSNGFSNLTNNRGTGEGGFIFRTVNSDNTAEIGRVSFSSTGGISAGADIRAAGNLTAAGGIVAVNSDGSRSLTWDGSQYGLPAAPLAVNGSQVVTQATFQAALLANQQANGVGAVAVGNSGSPVPVLPGSWAATGTASNSVYLWVRVI
jgi:hypothetical protein